MNASIIYDPRFPHGTPEGYREGCRGSHCPAEMSCREVHRRYVGDFRFKRRFDEGMTPAEIAAAEAAEVVKPKPKPKPKRKRRIPGSDPERLALIRSLHAEGLQDQQIGKRLGIGARRVCELRALLGLRSNRVLALEHIKRRNGEGWTDAEIAAELGRSRRSVTSARHNLGLPLNREVRV